MEQNGTMLLRYIMCGRYVFFDERNKTFKIWIDQAEKQFPEKIFREISLFEVFPGQIVLCAAIGSAKQNVQLSLMRWGYIGKKNKLIINARSETAEHSLFFKNSHRCVIPASGYYEWSDYPKIKYYFTAENQETIYFAGLCRNFDDQLHMVILTEAAKEPESLIHDRQPIIFNTKQAEDWCRGGDYQSLIQSSAAKRLMKKAE
ncbi:MAG: hypothetical protein EOM64_09295 [Erysipelotrichia bacterium]|nr:hypothetical protein [Erysipelotrichia bacterium]